MIFVSNTKTTAPRVYKTSLQEKVYNTLEKLNIQFERVDTDEAITMEDCVEISKHLKCPVVKLFFCAIGKKQTFICL